MGVPKQFIPLRGVPVIAYTLSAFEQAASIDEIVLVARKEHMLQYYDIVKRQADPDRTGWEQPTGIRCARDLRLP